MSYRLKTGEAIAAGMRRIAREQLESALCEIAAATPVNEADAVHAARRCIKRTRALLRLIREEIGREIFKEENRSLRDVARSFSGPRDARVQLQLLEKLREQVPQSLAFEKTTATLQEEIATNSDTFGPQRQAAEATLQLICDRIEGWPLDNLGMDDLCCALRSSYQRGRKFYRCVCAKKTPEDFHAWRRRVKDFWYQSRLLCNLNRTVMCEITEAVGTLGKKLGTLHDLAFFRLHLLGRQGIDEEEGSVLFGLICTRESELEEVVLDFGARFFAEKSGAFERRLLRYARDWPAQAGA
jgi:CHAD domain-containing protein